MEVKFNKAFYKMLFKYNIKLFFFIGKILQNQKKNINNTNYFKKLAPSMNKTMKTHIKLIGEIPDSQNFIIYSNHRGLYDPIVFYTLLDNKDFSFVIKNVLQNKFMDKIVQTTNSKYFSQNPRQDNEKISEILDSNTNMIIFPEGCRSHTDQLNDFKAGAFKIAMKSGKNILPVVITNTENIWDSGCHGSKEIFVKFLEPITAEEYDNKTSKEIANELKSKMQDVYMTLKNM